MTGVLIIGSILADIGLGAAAYKATKELKRIADNFDVRLRDVEIKLEPQNANWITDRSGVSLPTGYTISIPLKSSK